MTVSVSTSIPETAFNRRTVESKPLTNDIQLANQFKLNLGAGQKEEHNVQKIEEKQPEPVFKLEFQRVSIPIQLDPSCTFC